jgi:hypothetical protein
MLLTLRRHPNWFADKPSTLIGQWRYYLTEAGYLGFGLTRVDLCFKTTRMLWYTTSDPLAMDEQFPKQANGARLKSGIIRGAGFIDFFLPRKSWSIPSIPLPCGQLAVVLRESVEADMTLDQSPCLCRKMFPSLSAELSVAQPKRSSWSGWILWIVGVSGSLPWRKPIMENVKFTDGGFCHGQH